MIQRYTVTKYFDTRTPTAAPLHSVFDEIQNRGAMKGYYTRSDNQEAHMFKAQLIDKETHIREDHPYLLNKKAANLRRPRNVLLAEPTPRSRPGKLFVLLYDS